MQFDFSNKNILITGGAKGVGRQIAKLFSQLGGHVAVIDLNIDDETKKNYYIEQSFCADVSDPVQVENVFKSFYDLIGPVDILINNASIYPTCDFFDLTPESWQKMLDIDLNSVFFCTKEAAGQMIKSNIKGSIINITTIDAFHPSYGHAHYCAAKAGVYSLTRSCASRLGEYGIRVNSIAPGLINRPTLKEDWPDGFNRYMEKAPIKIIPEGIDIAYACGFLSSDYARAITGIEMPIDSGILTCEPY